MLSRLWQKFKAHWFKYLLLMACAGGTLFGLLLVAGVWLFPIPTGYYQMITVNPAAIASTPMGEANIPTWLPGFLSLWLLVCAMSFVAVLLWLRQQFSLKVMLIAVFIAAGLASLPQTLHTPPATVAQIHLMATSAPPQYLLTDADADGIVAKLDAQQFFRTLPDEMVRELRLTPDMLLSAALKDMDKDQTDNWRVIELKFSESASREQTATLAQAAGHFVAQEITDIYAQQVSPAPPYNAVHLSFNSRSQWEKYAKAWDERRAKAAVLTPPAPPPSVQVRGQ